MDMMLTWLTRSDVDDDHRNSAEKLLPLVFEPKRGKRAPDWDGDDHA